MLSFDQLDVIGDPIVELYEQMYIRIIKQIAHVLQLICGVDYNDLRTIGLTIFKRKKNEFWKSFYVHF